MTVIDLHSITLEGNPDGSVWSSKFDEAVWSASKKLAPLLEQHIELKGERIPSDNWLSSFIQAFTAVAYKNKRVYNRRDYFSFWLPAIKQENHMLDNITKIIYPDKFNRAMGGLRELHEKGLVPNIIWRPNTIKKYSHIPIDPASKGVEIVKDLAQGTGEIIGKMAFGKLGLAIAIGIGVYVGVPALIKRGKK